MDLSSPVPWVGCCAEWCSSHARCSAARCSGASSRTCTCPRASVVDPTLRSIAAAVLTAPDGVVSGWSAAELLDASCGPADAPAEVTLPSGHFRRRVLGLVVHRDRLDADEITTVGGIAVTSPLRTAFDLVRWQDPDRGRRRARHPGPPPRSRRRAAHGPAPQTPRRPRGAEGLARWSGWPIRRPSRRWRAGSGWHWSFAGLPAPVTQYPVSSTAGPFASTWRTRPSGSASSTTGGSIAASDCGRP